MSASTEPSKSFLSELAEALTDQTGTDIELANILKAQILQENGSDQSVTRAKEAIIKLAADRGLASQSEHHG